MNSTKLRPVTQMDALACAEIHLCAFPGFFLTFLGTDFLCELYTAIACDPSGIGFVAEEHGRILGFVVGTSQPSGFYSRLLRSRMWHFGWTSLVPFLKKPQILPRLLRAFTMPGQKTCVPNCGTLMSIAVLPQTQGKGVGLRLVNAFLGEAERRGLQYVNLTTDLLDNECANRFYQKLGFSLLRSYTTPEGRQMNEYIYDICSVLSVELQEAKDFKEQKEIGQVQSASI